MRSIQSAASQGPHPILKAFSMRTNLNRSMPTSAVIFAIIAITTPITLAQPQMGNRNPQVSQQQSQYIADLQQVINNKAAYAAAIVQRWEATARASQKWNSTYEVDFQNALTRLQPENLL